MTKQKNPIVVLPRVLLTFLTIIGLFCVLTGCGSLLREATDKDPSHQTAFPQTMNPETVDVETQKVRETETSAKMKPEPIINFENTPSEDAALWIERYSRNADPHALLLDNDGIAALNRRIREVCPTMSDMQSIPTSISGNEIAERINAIANSVGAGIRDKYAENANIAAIANDVIPRTAVITERANIRNLPTSENYYTENDPNHYYDRIQEAELILGTPVLVLHESLDGAFCFVRSYYYHGWVETSRLALAGEADYLRFLPDNDGMVTITADAAALTDGTRLDMGAAFPYLASDQDAFTIDIPRRNSDGSLTTEAVIIEKTVSHYGRLPYTWANFAAQAFKFLGTTYSWGGYNEGVDCSGFVCAVFRSFGIELPRNTGEQKEYSGTITSLSNQSDNDIKCVLSGLFMPTTIHRPGHVMLYLGIVDNTVFVIHAPSGGQTVSVMPLTKLDNLICAASIE